MKRLDIDAISGSELRDGGVGDSQVVLAAPRGQPAAHRTRADQGQLTAPMKLQQLWTGRQDADAAVHWLASVGAVPSRSFT